jgi:hypothetical protein
MKTVLGFALMFAGMGLAVACMFSAGMQPTIPLWEFVGAAVLLGAPLMIAGGRLAHQGSVPVGTPPEQAEATYQRETFRAAVAIGCMAIGGLLMAAPVFVMATGLVPWDPTFAVWWYGGWCVVGKLGSRRIFRPLFKAIEQRALAWKFGDRG